MVIFFETTAGSCGTCRKSPSTSCRVCLPGGRVSVVSVCPLPKWTLFSFAAKRLRQVRRQFAVDEQVVVAGAVELDPGGRHAHALEPEHDGNRALDLGAVLGRDDVDLGAGGRRLARAMASGGRQRGGAGRGDVHGGSWILVWRKVVNAPRGWLRSRSSARV